MNRQFQHMRPQILRLGITRPLRRGTDFVPEFHRSDTPPPQGPGYRVLVPHQYGKEQRADAFIQVFPQHGYPALQFLPQMQEVLPTLPAYAAIVEPLDDRITDGGHGNVHVANVPPDVANPNSDRQRV